MMIAAEVEVPYVDPLDPTYCHIDEWSPLSTPHVVDNFDGASE
jgi:hypothetical protein